MCNAWEENKALVYFAIDHVVFLAFPRETGSLQSPHLAPLAAPAHSMPQPSPGSSTATHAQQADAASSIVNGVSRLNTPLDATGPISD